MNRNIGVEYRIDKDSDIDPGSESDPVMRHVSKIPGHMNRINEFIFRGGRGEKSKDKKRIFKPQKKSVLDSSTESSDTSSSDSSGYPIRGILTEHGFPMFGIDSQFHYETFSSQYLQDLTLFDTSYPLILRWLTDRYCPDTKTITDMDMIDKSMPHIQVITDAQSDLYLRQIIKTYNTLQTQYVNLMNTLRETLIKLGVIEFADPRYIMEPIIINYKSMPNITDAFYEYMKGLKQDVNRIVHSVEKLYAVVNAKVDVQGNEVQTKQIKAFYKELHEKKVPFVSNQGYEKSELNQKLGDIFNMLGGSSLNHRINETSDNRTILGAEYRVLLGGNASLNDTDVLVSELRDRMEMYKKSLKPWDLTKIHRMNDTDRSLLITEQQKTFETEPMTRNKKLYIDTFDKLDKDDLLDEMIKRKDFLHPDPMPDIVIKMDTYDPLSLIGSINEMYVDPMDKLKWIKITKTIEHNQDFIYYRFMDMNDNDFTFTDDIFIDQKTKNKMKDHLNEQNRKIIVELNQSIKTHTKISRIPGLTKAIAMMFAIMVDAKKITSTINPYANVTLKTLYATIKRMSNISQYIKNVKLGYEKMNELLRYFSKEGYTGLKKTSSVRKIFLSKFGEDNTYFFDTVISGSKPLKYNTSTERINAGEILGANLNTEAVGYHSSASVLSDKMVLINKVKALKELDAKLNKTSDKTMGKGLFPGGSGINTDEYSGYFSRYIESTEKLLDIEVDVLIDVKAETLIEIDKILDKKVNEENVLANSVDKIVDFTHPSTVQIQNKESTTVRTYMESLDPSYNFMETMVKHIDDYNNIDLMANHIQTAYLSLIQESTQNMEALQKQVLDSSSVAYLPISEQLVIQSVDLVVMRLEIKELVDMMKNIVDFQDKIKTFNTGIRASINQIEKDAESSYFLKMKHNNDIGMMGGVLIETIPEITKRIESDGKSATQIINDLFNKIFEIETIKRDMGDVDSVIKTGIHTAKLVESIILFTLNVIQASIATCPEVEKVCNLKMLGYMEYQKLRQLKDFLENILSSKESETINNPNIAQVYGPMIRTSNFLQRLFSVGDKIVDKHIRYVKVDIKKKSFIPLLIAQSLMFYDFGV